MPRWIITRKLEETGSQQQPRSFETVSHREHRGLPSAPEVSEALGYRLPQPVRPWFCLLSSSLIFPQSKLHCRDTGTNSSTWQRQQPLLAVCESRCAAARPDKSCRVFGRKEFALSKLSLSFHLCRPLGFGTLATSHQKDVTQGQVNQFMP